MERGAFKFDSTNFNYEVHQRRIPHKHFKSMPTDFILEINHSRRKEFYVGTGGGDFHPADAQQTLTVVKSFVVDSSVFSFRDEYSVHRAVDRALFAAGIDRNLWEAISDAEMVEGTRMVKSNLDIYGEIQTALAVFLMQLRFALSLWRASFVMRMLESVEPCA